MVPDSATRTRRVSEGLAEASGLCTADSYTEIFRSIGRRRTPTGDIHFALGPGRGRSYPGGERFSGGCHAAIVRLLWIQLGQPGGLYGECVPPGPIAGR